MEHSLFIMSIFIAALPIAGSGSVTTALIPSVCAGRPSLTESRLRISPPSSGCLLGGYFTTAPTPVLVIDPSDSRSLYLAEGEDEDGGYGSPQKHDGGASLNGIWDFSSGLQSGLNALVIDRGNPTTNAIGA